MASTSRMSTSSISYISVAPCSTAHRYPITFLLCGTRGLRIMSTIILRVERPQTAQKPEAETPPTRDGMKEWNAVLGNPNSSVSPNLICQYFVAANLVVFPCLLLQQPSSLTHLPILWLILYGSSYLWLRPICSEYLPHLPLPEVGECSMQSAEQSKLQQ